MAIEDYDLFMDNVLRKTGIDLHKYKRPQMERRLTALREKHGFKNFAGYFAALDQDQNMFYEFLDRMTINVSEFFRNANRWDVVMQRIVPDMLKQKKKVKIWSAASSTGEEPYTLALIMAKYVQLSEIEILATDIDQNVIARAKQGVYPARSLESVPKDLLQKYFTKHENGMYEVAPEIKRCVNFQHQNLLEDQFGKEFDLIVCRNVIIYFTEEAKDKLYHKFANALRPGGILFVGSTEQIFNPQSYNFKTYDTFFYQKG